MKGVASDDLGMDSGPFMHTESYRALFKPRHAQLCDYVHKHRDSGSNSLALSARQIYPDHVWKSITNCHDTERIEWPRRPE